MQDKPRDQRLHAPPKAVHICMEISKVLLSPAYTVRFEVGLLDEDNAAWLYVVLGRVLRSCSNER